MSEQLHPPVFPRPLMGDPVTNLPSGLVPARANITGQHVQLEPLDPAIHTQGLYQEGHSTDQGLKIWDYLAYGPWSNEAAYKTTLAQQAASFEPIFFAIRDLKTNKVCGQASFLDMNPTNGVIEIGHIWFGPSLQKTRGATEALFLMLTHAMDDLKYRRMEWRCNALNQGSRNAAARLGFRFEGIFFNHMIFKGKNRDTSWYSILDNEWPEVREIIAKWLDDANFDEQGLALSSLGELMQERVNNRRTI